MLGLMGFSGSLPLFVTIIHIIICMFINWANKNACLLALRQCPVLQIVRSIHKKCTHLRNTQKERSD